MQPFPKILIFYQYFLPAYKAGGPIQSIANMCRQLKGLYEFYIICGSTENTEQEVLKGIRVDEWNDFENGTASVHYVSEQLLNKARILSLIEELEPDMLFINGLYSYHFSIVPLLFSNHKKILSVRGMLHPGALSQKSFKKKIFLTFLRSAGISKKIIFHATNTKEKEYIKQAFGAQSKVVIAQNFPIGEAELNSKIKKVGDIKLVSIGLISPMKNHALVLQALQKVRCSVTYHIYGPIKDARYWADCTALLKELPANCNVEYKGSLKPADVLKTLAGYHAFILPSKSENFGHAIYEALISGLPVITSHFTPWNNLEEHFAGWNVDIDRIETIKNAIDHISSFDSKEYELWQECSRKFAQINVNVSSIKNQYGTLFSWNHIGAVL